MRTSLLALLLLGAWGCGNKGTTVATGPDGEKITTDGRGNMTIDDGKGGEVKVQADGESWKATGPDGVEVNVKDGVVTGTNDKGEKFSSGAAVLSEADLGLPFYPGSKPIQGRDMRSEADGQITIISFRSTSDSPEKVVAFYKGKVESPATTTTGEMGSVSGKVKGADVGVTALVIDGETQVSIAVSKKG